MINKIKDYFLLVVFSITFFFQAIFLGLWLWLKEIFSNKEDET